METINLPQESLTVPDYNLEDAFVNVTIALIERGLIPDVLTRMGIRRLLTLRLREEDRGNVETQAKNRARFIQHLSNSPIALHTDAANVQHYELPVEFFQRIMGKHLKYSACYWPSKTTTLDEAEAKMLALTCERAQLADGQAILELGCGWGSLTLWMAEQYQNASIQAVSNSTSQRTFIESQCQQRNLNNVRVITADMNDFQSRQRFDRVVSVEMFEHMRNYRQLLARIAQWLAPGGKLFVHVFSHRRFAYLFQTHNAKDWMSQYFFTGGIMPSADLLPHFQEDLRLEARWCINGRHYQRTCEAWLVNQDRHREAILSVFREVYGPTYASRWFQRWRVFFMACAELFSYQRGEEWGVSHYRFSKPFNYPESVAID